ncbi:MAG: DUF2892 domain-containing protein [Patescibacteria group bacterium]|jgi:hypothetical protein
MKQNMAPWDRGVRLVIAAILLFLVFGTYVHGAVAWILAVVGFIFMFTGLTGFCLLYALLKLSTIRDSSAE